MKKKMTMTLAAAALVAGGLVVSAAPASAAVAANYPAQSCAQGTVFVTGATQYNSSYSVSRSGSSPKTATYADGIAYTTHILYAGFAVSTGESITTTGAAIKNGRANCGD